MAAKTSADGIARGIRTVNRAVRHLRLLALCAQPALLAASAAPPSLLTCLKIGHHGAAKLLEYRITGVAAPACVSTATVNGVLPAVAAGKDEWGNTEFHHYVVHAAVSPRHRRLALLFDDGLWAYDLTTGRKAPVWADARGAGQVGWWCGFASDNLLQVHGNDGDRSMWRTFRLSSTGVVAANTGAGSAALPATQFAKAAEAAGKTLERLHIPQPLAYEQSGAEPMSSFFGDFPGYGDGAISRDGRSIAMAEGNGGIVVVVDGRKVGMIEAGHGDDVSDLEFVGGLLVWATRWAGGGRIRVWSISPLKEVGAIDADYIVHESPYLKNR